MTRSSNPPVFLSASHSATLLLAAIWLSLAVMASQQLDAKGGASFATEETGLTSAPATAPASTPPAHPLLRWILGRPLDFSRSSSATPSEWAAVFLGSRTVDESLASDSSAEENSELESALMNRIRELHPELTIPTTLRSNLLFWSRVYSEWSSRQFVVFDERHPERIYEVLDFRELERKSRNAVAFEISVENEINRRRARYRAAFDALAKEVRRQGVKGSRSASLSEQVSSLDPARLSPEAAKIQSTLAAARCNDPSGHSLLELRSNLRFQRGQRDQVLIALLRFEGYRPWVEEIFRREGVPVALSRLALVESSFNWKAESRVGAVGVWQFMPASAKAFLNQVPSDGIDERRSVIKSAVAAARLLRQNHRILGNWSLAVVAYNSGMRAPLKIPKANRISGNFDSLISSCGPRSRTTKSALGFASRNYLSEFLAMTLIEDEHERIFGSDVFQAFTRDNGPIHGRYIFERVTSGSRPLSLRGLIARHGGVSPRWAALNPEISDPARPLPKFLWIARPLDDHGFDLSQRVTTFSTPGDVTSRVDHNLKPPSDSS